MAALVQQTEEWLEVRKNKIGASDASVIMEVSPWKTPNQLWEEKVGIRENSFKNRAMKRGLEMEEKARLKFEEMTGIFVLPKVIFHPQINWMMASLDGIDLNQEHIVEIKCPGEIDHEIAKSEMIPEKYYPQLQHQLEVCEKDMLYYFSFDGKDGVIVEHYRNEKYIKNMVSKEKEFWECVQNFTAPKLSEKDYQKKSDEIWCAASEKWLSINEQLSELEKQEKEFREILISMSGKQNTIGGGIKLLRFMRKGAIDYSKIPQLSGVDLEIFRKSPTECWKLIKA